MPRRSPKPLKAHQPQKITGRPLLRLYHVDERAVRDREIPILRSRRRPYRAAVRPGERLVWWFDPNDLLHCPEQTLLDAFHAVLKRLREEAGALRLPTR